MEKGIKVTATFESFDQALLEELKGSVQGVLDEPWELAHCYKEALKNVDGYLVVISDFSKPTEYNDYLTSIKSQYNALVEKAFPKVSGPLDIQITNVRDLPDGGANIEYEASPEMKEFLMGVGFRKILEDACKEVLVEVEPMPEDVYFDDSVHDDNITAGSQEWEPSVGDKVLVISNYGGDELDSSFHNIPCVGEVLCVGHHAEDHVEVEDEGGYVQLVSRSQIIPYEESRVPGWEYC
jgi:hypothetical protein